MEKEGRKKKESNRSPNVVRSDTILLLASTAFGSIHLEN